MKGHIVLYVLVCWTNVLWTINRKFIKPYNLVHACSTHMSFFSKVLQREEYSYGDLQTSIYQKMKMSPFNSELFNLYAVFPIFEKLISPMKELFYFFSNKIINTEHAGKVGIYISHEKHRIVIKLWYYWVVTKKDYS